MKIEFLFQRHSVKVALCHTYILCVSAAAVNMDVSDIFWEKALSLKQKILN